MLASCLDAEISPDCISWGLFFQIFLGVHAPRPPRKSMLCMLQVQVCQTNPELLPPPLMLHISDAPIIGQISDIGLIGTKIKLSASVKI